MAVSESNLEPRSTGAALAGESDSVTRAFHREWELLKSAPSTTVTGVQEKLSSLAAHPAKVAELVVEGAAVGVALAHLKTHPEALWGAGKHITKWAGTAGAALLAADMGIRVGVPAVDTWNNPASLAANKIRLGQNLGAAVVEYSTMGLAGAAGFKYGPQAIEQSSRLFRGADSMVSHNRALDFSPLPKSTTTAVESDASVQTISEAVQMAERNYALSRIKNELSSSVIDAVADGRKHTNDYYHEAQRDYFFENTFEPIWNEVVAKSGKDSSQLSEQKEAVAAVFREAFNSGNGKPEAKTRLSIVMDGEVYRGKLDEVWARTMAPQPKNAIAATKEKLWSTMVEALESGRDRMDSHDWMSSDLTALTEKFGQTWKGTDGLKQSESTQQAMKSLLAEATAVGRGGFESAEDMPLDITEFRTKFETIWRDGFGTRT